LPGHFCWACDRRRANEKFSGKGHARHVCRECEQLGKEELAYRQALRNLESLLTWEGVVPRRQRKRFEAFLKHRDPRVRACAQAVQERERAEAARDEADDTFGEVPL
jgi:hypothetical protein